MIIIFTHQFQVESKNLHDLIHVSITFFQAPTSPMCTQRFLLIFKRHEAYNLFLSIFLLLSFNRLIPKSQMPTVFCSAYNENTHNNWTHFAKQKEKEEEKWSNLKTFLLSHRNPKERFFFFVFLFTISEATNMN